MNETWSALCRSPTLTEPLTQLRATSKRRRSSRRAATPGGAKPKEGGGGGEEEEEEEDSTLGGSGVADRSADRLPHRDVSLAVPRSTFMLRGGFLIARVSVE